MPLIELDLRDSSSMPSAAICVVLIFSSNFSDKPRITRSPSSFLFFSLFIVSTVWFTLSSDCKILSFNSLNTERLFPTSLICVSALSLICCVEAAISSVLPSNSCNALYIIPEDSSSLSNAACTLCKISSDSLPCSSTVLNNSIARYTIKTHAAKRIIYTMPVNTQPISWWSFRKPAGNKTIITALNIIVTAALTLNTFCE